MRQRTKETRIEASLGARDSLKFDVPVPPKALPLSSHAGKELSEDAAENTHADNGVRLGDAPRAQVVQLQHQSIRRKWKTTSVLRRKEKVRTGGTTLKTAGVRCPTS